MIYSRIRWWVGYTSDCRRVAFKSQVTPTPESDCGRFGAVFGPFETRRGAEFAASDSAPYMVGVQDAERIAKNLGGVG